MCGGGTTPLLYEGVVPPPPRTNHDKKETNTMGNMNFDASEVERVLAAAAASRCPAIFQAT